MTLVIGGVFGLVAGSSPNFGSLCFFIAMVGFGVGGNLPVDGTLFIEFIPGSHQYLLTLLSIWWAIGQVVGSLIAVSGIPSKDECALTSQWVFQANYGCATRTSIPAHFAKSILTCQLLPENTAQEHPTWDGDTHSSLLVPCLSSSGMCIITSLKLPRWRPRANPQGRSIRHLPRLRVSQIPFLHWSRRRGRRGHSQGRQTKWKGFIIDCRRSQTRRGAIPRYRRGKHHHGPDETFHIRIDQALFRRRDW
jgi:MFS family permease